MRLGARVEPNPETPSLRHSVETALDMTPQGRRSARPSGASPYRLAYKRISAVARLRYAGIMVGCIALAVPLSPASAGFFDFLFSPARPPAAPFLRRPPMHFWHRQQARTHAYAERRQTHFEHHQKKVAMATRHKIVAAKADAVPRGVVDLMDDASLRNGDAVMTPDGLRVFVGDEGPHHSSDDFAKLSETEGLSKREQTALVAVDAAYQDAGKDAGEPPPALVTARSVAEAGLSVGVPIIDPKGRKVRYVGP